MRSGWRVLFDAEGQLRWWVARRTGNQLYILARSMRHREDARRRLEVANLRFDLGVERVWQHFFDCRIDLPVRGTLYRLLDRQGGAAAVEAALSHLSVTHPLLATLGFALLKDTHSPQSPAFWGMQELWIEGVRALARHWGEEPGTLEREWRRREELDRLSEHHLQAVAQEFDLAPLAETGCLGVEKDLLVQVQGPLLAAPLAWLRVGGQPLFTQVASISSVVSLTLGRLTELDAVNAGPIAPRLLTALWLPRGAREWPAFLRMADRIEQECRRRGWETVRLAANPWPEASVVNLRAALRVTSPRVGMAVVGGHGNSQKAGVDLADETWCGEGIDLGGLDWLLLPSCAVGRLEQLGDRDVRGLYARLVASGCRCVVAARWPVGDGETERWFTELVCRYLVLVPVPDRRPLFSRARVLNDARRRLTASGEVSFHHAAAFEMYGLG